MHIDTSPHMAASVADIDPVADYLAQRGIVTEVAYLGETEFELGRSARLGDLALIYRVEGRVLLICEIRSLRTSESLGSALRRFVRFVLQLNRSVTDIDVVRGVLPGGAKGPTGGLQERLRRIYLHRGARVNHRHNDDLEIEFTVQHLAP